MKIATMSTLGHGLSGLVKSCVLGLGLTLICAEAPAGPVNPVVKYGSVTFSYNPVTQTWTITSSTNKSIVNYTSFDIQKFEKVLFNQPGALSRFLNRVTADFDGTQINGSLRSNGILFFVNPAGVYFGNGAVVDVGGIYAAAGSISDADFKNDIDRFTNLTGPVVVAQGAQIGGGSFTTAMVHLLGRQVANHGNITVDGVVTLLAANNEILIQKVAGGPSVMVKLDGHWLDPNLSAPGGSPYIDGIPGVENTGTINAQNGQVILGAGDMYSLAIRNSGTINAAGGSVQMSALAGQVRHEGSLVAQDLSMSGSELFLDSDINADHARFNDAVVVGSDVTIEGQTAGSQAEEVVFTSTVDSEAGEFNDLEIDSASTDFQDDVGGTDKLGSLEVTGETMAAGDILAKNNLTFGDNLTLYGDSNQRVDAETGTLWAKADIVKTGSGDLALGGATGIDIDGGVDVQAGGLDVEDDAAIAGDVKADDWVHFAGSSDVGGGVTAGTWATFDGAADIEGDVIAGAAIEFKSIAELGGDVLGEGIHFWDDVTFDGTGGSADQTVDAGTGVLQANGNLTKTTAGSLTLGGDTDIDLDGDVRVLAGSLTIDDDFHAAMDLIASDDITLIGKGILDGIGTQRIDAETGTLRAHQDLVKTGAGDLYLGGAVDINLDGDVNVKAGSLVVEDDFHAAMDLIASDDITLIGKGVLDGTGDQQIDAETGKLWAQKELTKTGAGDLTLGGATDIDLDGDVRVQAGSLTLADDFHAAMDLIASKDINLIGRGILDGIGDQRIDAKTGTLRAHEDLIKTGAGDLYLGGAVDINLDGDVNVKTGSLVVEDDFHAAGDLIAYESLRLKGDGILDGAIDQRLDALTGKMRADGRLTKTGSGDLTLGGREGVLLFGQVRVDDGNFIVEDDARIEAGRITTSGTQTYEGKVQLAADTLFDATEGIVFVRSVDGPGWMKVRTEGDAFFGGNIGKDKRLAGFRTTVEGMTVFDGSVVQTIGDILLNTKVRTVGIPVYATIGATGSITFNSSSGDFKMGQHQKLTAVGSVFIDADGTARLGDINTLGDLHVTANAILLFTRDPGFVADAAGNIEDDLGLDFVAGGRFFFSVRPVRIGNGLVQFATLQKDPDALGNLRAFVMRLYDRDLTPAALHINPFFDLLASGPSITDLAEALSGADGDDTEGGGVQREVATEAAALQRLAQELNIQSRTLRPEELADLVAGRALYMDAPQSVLAEPEYSIALNRMPNRYVTEAIASLDRLIEEGDRPWSEMQADLDQAWQAYLATLDRETGAGPDPAGFVASLADPESEYRRSLTDLRLMHRLMQNIGILGLTDEEQARPKETLLTKILPGGITLEQMSRIVDEAGGTTPVAP